MQSNPQDQYARWDPPSSSQDSLLSGRGRVGIGIGVLVTAFLLYLLGGGFPPPVWIEVFRTLVGSALTPPRFPLLLVQSFILLIAWLVLLLVGLQVIRPSRTRSISNADSFNETSPAPDPRTPAISPRQEEISQRRTSPWKNASPQWNAQQTSSSPYWSNEDQYSGRQVPSAPAKDTSARSDEQRHSEEASPYAVQLPSHQNHMPPPLLRDNEAEEIHQRSGNNNASASLAMRQPYSSSAHFVKEIRRSDTSRLREDVAAPSLLTQQEDSSRGNTSMSTFRISAHNLPGLNPEGLELNGWSLCHPGIHRRNENLEDYLLITGGLRTQINPQIPFGLFILADGAIVPGEEEEASSQVSTSRLTAHQLSEAMLSALWSTDALDPQTVLRLLTDSMQQANTLLYQHNQRRQTNDIVTMTAMLVLGTEAYTANVGDNRAYLYRIKRSRQATDEGLFQITNDHSSVATQLEQGTLSPEELFKRPKTDHVYRALGQQATLTNLDVFSITLGTGDILVLCSDGLWKVVREATFQQIVERTIQPPVASPSLLCPALTQAALEAGGYDHASTMVVQALPL